MRDWSVLKLPQIVGCTCNIIVQDGPTSVEIRETELSVSGVMRTGRLCSSGYVERMDEGD